jgi:hypothetical protein
MSPKVKGKKIEAFNNSGLASSNSYLNNVFKEGNDFPYLNQNVIDIDDGDTSNLYYVTEGGAMKRYPGGRNGDVYKNVGGKYGCPIETSNSFGLNNVKQTAPYLYPGSPMKNQTCKGSGKNVIVDTETPVELSGGECYTGNSENSDILKMTAINNLNNPMTFNSCKRWAAEHKSPGGKMYFSLNGINSNEAEIKNLINYINTEPTIDDYNEFIDNYTSSSDSWIPHITTVRQWYEVFIDVYKKADQSEGICYYSTSDPNVNDLAINNPSWKTFQNEILKSTPYEKYSTLSSIPEDNIALSLTGNGIVAVVNILNNDIYYGWNFGFGCKNGGGINKEDIIATYGGNCNLGVGNYTPFILPTYDSSIINPLSALSTMTVHGINSSVKAKVNCRDHYKNWIIQKIRWNNPQDCDEVDQANITPIPTRENCNGDLANFSASWTCGNNPTVMSGGLIENANASTTYNFDCKNTVNSCSYILKIEDDGILSIYSLRDDIKSKNDITYIDITTLDNYTVLEGVLAKPEDFGISINDTTPVAKYKSSNSKAMCFSNNTDSGNVTYTSKNWLRTGDFLSNEEWVGSPNGSCYFIMSHNILYIVYNLKMMTCTSGLGDNSGYNIGSINTLSYDINYNGQKTQNYNAVYQITNQVYPDNMNKIGYMDWDLNMYQYPDDATQHTNTYRRIPDYDLWGNDITMNYVKDIDECEQKCNEYGEGCGAYTMLGNDCYLKTDAVRRSPKYFHGEGAYNSGIRNKELKPGVTTCAGGKQIESYNDNDWEFAYKPYGNNNAPINAINQSCEVTYLDTGVNNDMNTQRNLITSTSNELKGISERTENDIHNFKASRINYSNILNSVSNNQKDLLYNNINQYMEPFVDLQTLDEMNNQSDLIKTKNMFRYAFWMIIAIVMIIVAIKLMTYK